MDAEWLIALPSWFELSVAAGANRVTKNTRKLDKLELKVI